MQSLNESVKEYTVQLQQGHIQKAYKGIMIFMSGLKTWLESRDTECTATGLYPGYMDMTYFAFTPQVLKQRSLKIAIVYLHEQNRFEVWLGGANRRVQAETIDLFKGKDLDGLTLSRIEPGVDSIVEMKLVENPDFDHPEELMLAIESKVIEFTEKIVKLLPK